MSEETTESGIVVVKNGGMRRRWRIRIMSKEPVLIDDTSAFTGTPTEAHQRAYVLARRTSFMVNGPNREIWGYVEGYSTKKREFIRVFEFKTRLREGSEPE